MYWSARCDCRGATVHLVCRSKEKGEKAVGEIKAKTGNPNVSLQVTNQVCLATLKRLGILVAGCTTSQMNFQKTI